ncbi:hypothetical protein AZF04_15025 [Alkalihalobacillus trypoxylicola]|uniref:Small multi-drug export protein n=2 Tax=Alkalihalobacillus trypoxylicola TaxID=519424 RepID=A0A162F0F2_9BACI|nr:hypothetical protein AZF04_15025 [Alkalihalobacillus trypoxylicola]
MMQDIIRYIHDLDVIYQYLGIFIISIIPFFESYLAIPVGIALGFPTIAVIIIGIVGNILSVVAFIWLIDKFRKPKKDKEGGRWKRAQGLFQKYGVPGVSFAGPLYGYHIGAIIAIAAGTSREYVTLWQIIAISVWSMAIGIAFHFGFQLFI